MADLSNLSHKLILSQMSLLIGITIADSIISRTIKDLFGLVDNRVLRLRGKMARLGLYEKTI